MNNMKKTIIILVSIITLAISCQSGSKIDENEKALSFFKRVFYESIDRSPIYQSYLGIKKDYDKLDDISYENSLNEIEMAKKELSNLKDSIDFEKLSKDNKLNYLLMQKDLERTISEEKYLLYDYPANQMFGNHSTIPAFMINIHQISDVDDAKAYISRLKNFAPYFEQWIQSLTKREEIGVMPPKFVFDYVIKDCKNIITGSPFDESDKISALYDDFLNKIERLEISDDLKDSLDFEANDVLVEVVKPTYLKMIDFLSKQKERATNDDGVWKMKDGKDYYNFLLKETTTLDLSVEEIFEKGNSEIERIHKEMEVIKNKVGFTGSLQEFFDYMREDAKFYYPNTDAGREECLRDAVFLIDSMKSRLDELFIRKPKADIVVKKVEEFRETSAGKAFYQLPALDGSRPGIYYINLYNMKDMPKYQMEALAYHEGIPGHHMQIAMTQEFEGLPDFRKFLDFTAYIEGWGLYSELVPKEIGFYSDPYSDFGRLAMELFRSCRMVVDVGIHAKKWTRQQAIDFYRKNTSDSEKDCISMVDRHIVMPSQATAYKVGMLKILELREKTQDALADKFDIREFHDVILGSGALPLDIVSQNIDEYIESKK